VLAWLSAPGLAHAQTAATPLVYAQIGHTVLRGDRTYQMPGFGIGYRRQARSWAIDTALQLQIKRAGGVAPNRDAFAASARVQALRLLNPWGTTSAYLGGGVSYGGSSFGGGLTGGPEGRPSFQTKWEGRGGQIHLTVGYERARFARWRWFVQAEGALPLYQVTSKTSPFLSNSTVIAHRYAPSAVVSVGIGWQP